MVASIPVKYISFICIWKCLTACLPALRMHTLWSLADNVLLGIIPSCDSAGTGGSNPCLSRHRSSSSSSSSSSGNLGHYWA